MTVAVLGNTVNDRMAQSVARVVVDESIAVKSTEALVGGEPDVSLGILVDGGDAVIDQPFRDAVMTDREVLRRRVCGQSVEDHGDQNQRDDAVVREGDL